MTRVVACCLTVVLVTAIVPIAQAQDDGPNFINLRLIEVHADKVSEFEDLMKQRSAAEAKAGERFNQVFQRLRGVLNGYLIISPGDGSESVEVDLPDSWGPSMSQAIKNHTRVTAATGPRTLPDGSVAPDGEYLYVRLRTVQPGKVAAYRDWQANKLIPALRELGIGDVRSAKVVLGGNPATFVRFAFMDDWPGGDGGAGGPLADILAEESAMLATSQNLFYRVRDDLSFTASD
jgi:hypothetical protein